MAKMFFNSTPSSLFLAKNDIKLRGKMVYIAPAIIDFVCYRNLKNQSVYLGTISDAYENILTVSEITKTVSKLVKLEILIKKRTDQIFVNESFFKYIFEFRPLTKKEKEIFQETEKQQNIGKEGIDWFEQTDDIGYLDPKDVEYPELEMDEEHRAFLNALTLNAK